MTGPIRRAIETTPVAPTAAAPQAKLDDHVVETENEGLLFIRHANFVTTGSISTDENDAGRIALKIGVKGEAGRVGMAMLLTPDPETARTLAVSLNHLADEMETAAAAAAEALIARVQRK